MGLINPQSNNSCNYIFNSPISVEAIRYGVRAIGITPGCKSITNYTCRLAGTSANSSRNTLGKSLTISISHTSCFFKLDCIAYARYNFPPLLIHFQNFPLRSHRFFHNVFNHVFLFLNHTELQLIKSSHHTEYDHD